MLGICFFTLGENTLKMLGICLRLAPRAGGGSSIGFLRCGLRPSLRKTIDNPVATTISVADDSHFEWTINWKGAIPMCLMKHLNHEIRVSIDENFFLSGKTAFACLRTN